MNILILGAILLAWSYDPLEDRKCVDTLEWSKDLKTWVGVPGPYAVTNGDWLCWVSEPGFYRVRRDVRNTRQQTKPEGE